MAVGRSVSKRAKSVLMYFMDGPILQCSDCNIEIIVRPNGQLRLHGHLLGIAVESIMLHYCEKLMGVVVFANDQGQLQFEGSWTLAFQILLVCEPLSKLLLPLTQFRRAKPDLQFFDGYISIPN